MEKNTHAVLITAYKNYQYLVFLARWLTKNFDVYVHIDKKSIEIGCEEQAELKRIGCHVISNYSICWGGVNHLYAVLDLLRLAVVNEYDYYHLISGEDVLVNSYAQVQERFSGNDKIYISCHDAVRDPMWNIRYRYWYFFKNKDIRARFYRNVNQLSLGLQKLFCVNRRSIGGEENICKGYLYGDFPHDAVQYVLRYVATNPKFLRDLEYTYTPEEFFFQTIFINSPLRDRIAYNCLRYSIWEYKHGSIPGYLDETDWPMIRSGDYLFARKVNYQMSETLISMAKDYYDAE